MIETETPLAGTVLALAHEMARALQSNRLDEAEALLNELQQLGGLPDDDRDLLVYRVTIAIQRGQVQDALVMLNNFGEDRCPELRAVCLYLLKDPTWHGVATAVEEEASDEKVRLAMRQLLGKEDCEN